jgi:hypothetical protein
MPRSLRVSAPIDLQAQPHDTQNSLASHVNKGRAPESAFAEYDAIKREVSLLRQLVEKTIGRGIWDRVREEDDFGGAAAESDDDDARSVRTVVPHELEGVEEEETVRNTCEAEGT